MPGKPPKASEKDWSASVRAPTSKRPRASQTAISDFQKDSADTSALTPALSTVRWKRRQGRGKATFEFEFDRPNTAGLTRLSAAGEQTLNKTITKKAEPPPTRGVNRDSGTDSANGGWLRRLVRRHKCIL